ncbi:MAG: ABC transporter ATP-binding protein [Candidatus Nanohaloarchaea archaeon]
MIEVESVSRNFGDLKVLEDVTLSVDEGKTGVCLGPSGCGKTTLIKILSGLLDSSEGSYRVEGRKAVVFQDPRLLPWRTVEDNLKILEQISEVDVEENLEEVLDMVGLEDFRDTYPGQISGGMRQRLALARGLIIDPEVLFLDEPFASLDYITKKRLTDLVSDIIEDDITVLAATHDLDVALALADQIFILGRDPCSVVEVREVGEEIEKEELEDRLSNSYEEIRDGGEG